MLEEARGMSPVIAARSSVVYNGARTPTSLPASFPAEPRILCLGQVYERIASGFWRNAGSLARGWRAHR